MLCCVWWRASTRAVYHGTYFELSKRQPLLLLARQRFLQPVIHNAARPCMSVGEGGSTYVRTIPYGRETDDCVGGWWCGVGMSSHTERRLNQRKGRRARREHTGREQRYSAGRTWQTYCQPSPSLSSSQTSFLRLLSRHLPSQLFTMFHTHSTVTA